MDFNFIYEWILVSHFNKIHNFFFAPQCTCYFFVFSILLVLVQIIGKIYCMLHITSYHHYSLVEIHLYQGRLFQFVMLCHWHMNMCCPIKLHVDMLTLFKRLITKNCMSMQKVRMENYFLHLTCGNNHDGVCLIWCMVLNFLFTCFLTS
jgi:hypothetical protein